VWVTPPFLMAGLAGGVRLTGPNILAKVPAGVIGGPVKMG
jgi:hypothetical protein